MGFKVASWKIVGVALTFLFINGVAFAQSADEIFQNVQIQKALQKQLALSISEHIIGRIREEVSLNPNVGFPLGSLLEPEPKQPLLPDFEDPLILNETRIELDIPIEVPELSARVYLDFNLTDKSTVNGLGRKVDDFNLNLITFRFTWDLRFPGAVNISGPYQMVALVDLGTILQVSGQGNFFAQIDDFMVNLSGRLKAAGLIGLTELDLDFDFSDISVDGDEATSGDGTPVDWPQFSDNLHTFLKTLWNDESRPLIVEMVRCSVDHVINGCTLAELIGGNLECLKIELNPDCFGEEPTPTTDGATPTDPSTTTEDTPDDGDNGGGALTPTVTALIAAVVAVTLLQLAISF